MDLSTQIVLCAAPVLWLIFERGRTLLMFFQQEEYAYGRFLYWWVSRLAVDRLATALYLVGAVATISDIGTGDLVIISVGALILAPFVGVIVSRQTKAEAKKPLVMTARASRILIFFCFFAFLFLVAGSLYARVTPLDFETLRLPLFAFMMIGLIQGMPLIILLADLALKPLENRIKKRYLKEAKTKLSLLAPRIIAITGSFGKTSTKNILAHILGSTAPTLATPGSVNTEMGITRIIREQLKPHHRFFLVEMGAYGPGSIARLCALTPPEASMITAVGPAHYERFKSLDAVADTKFEIAEACVDHGGPVILSENGIPQEFRQRKMATVDANYTLVGPNGTIELVEKRQSSQGVEVVLRETLETGEDLEPQVEEIALRAPLFGLHQAENVALAAVMARKLGLPWQIIKAALRNAPQIRHRLEVSRAAGQATILDDAYNSNPRGFKAALDVLPLLAKPTGKRILITPGMVELGSLHDQEHRKMGLAAAKICSHILVVTPDRIPSFVDAVKKSHGNAILETYPTQKAAEDRLKTLAGEGDAILYENNLPDLYEAKVRF